MGMRVQWAVPVIVSILILGTLGFSQDAFAPGGAFKTNFMFTFGSVTHGAESHTATAELSGGLVTLTSSFEPSHSHTPFTNVVVEMQSLSGQHGKMTLDNGDKKSIHYVPSAKNFNTSFRSLVQCFDFSGNHVFTHDHSWTTSGDFHNQGNTIPGLLNWGHSAFSDGLGSCPSVASVPFVVDFSQLIFSGTDKKGNAISGSFSGGFPTIT